IHTFIQSHVRHSSDVFTATDFDGVTGIHFVVKKTTVRKNKNYLKYSKTNVYSEKTNKPGNSFLAFSGNSVGNLQFDVISGVRREVVRRRPAGAGIHYIYIHFYL